MGVDNGWVEPVGEGESGASNGERESSDGVGGI